MIDALTLLDDFQIAESYDDDEVVETVTYLYLAIRLKPLLTKDYAKIYQINMISKTLADNYLEHNLSLDLMINAVYNYINETKKCPSLYQINEDNIEDFLEKYSE